MVRDTQQRSAIRKVLIDAGRPLSVNEVLKLAQNEVAGLGIATVYRNLKALQQEGWIVQVDLPGQAPRWEKAQKNHHHHFLCRTCDKLLEIHDCPEGLKQLLPEGYTLEEHDILLRGLCDNCARKAKPRIT
ncbi:MAG: transcriptional repressor [Dehalococcoidales bacterium]|nr:transcriptional repressor [Dehalococcoidales bacterium]